MKVDWKLELLGKTESLWFILVLSWRYNKYSGAQIVTSRCDGLALDLDNRQQIKTKATG